MSDEAKDVSGKHLSAKELLSNRKKNSRAWNEWEESSQALPKTGAKQFEPNGSWLQNRQIEKGLESRKILLGIERVERISQLASAEWLPEQKKARVTKKSGQDWNTYGVEINSNLYLIGEEALLLLETESLELLWEGVPLSIEQAYNVLIDSENSDCSLNEYRVYSQLTRLGYRLQRFYYEKSHLERFARSDESVQRKKVIVDPENGLWMAGNNAESNESTQAQKPDVHNDIKEIVEKMVTSINGVETKANKSTNNSSNRPGKTEDSKDETSQERKGKNAKVEIISEQTILSPIKIVKDSDQPVSKWPGSRIQRNVKLLPKRNDKTPITNTETSPINASSSKSEISDRPGKRNRAQSNADSPKSKKSKHEVIELSDDEIEEIPRPMSRMEMLNCLPNIANGIFITENISRRYIPRGIRPQSSYRYDNRRLKEMHNTDKVSRINSRVSSEGKTNGSHSSISENDSTSQALVPYQRNSRYNQSPSNYNRSNNYYSRNTNRPYFSNTNQYSPHSLMMGLSAGICMQQMGWHDSQNMMTANRWTSFQMNMFRNAALMGYAMRNFCMQNAYNSNFQHNTSFAMTQQNRSHRYLDLPRRGSCSPRSRGSSQPGPSTSREPDRPTQQQSNDDVYQSTFTNIPGTLSWAELKQKWRDAKTITIDDEDCGNFNRNDNSEIQVVDQTVQPLIGPKTARNMSEIYERLRIIKSAPDRTVRRKKGDFKISYNVYPINQHFRKSNPGLPMYHLVVTSRKESDFLQPVELNRLQQDGKGAPIMFAHVSNSSIAYFQPGLVSVPNLI